MVNINKLEIIECLNEVLPRNYDIYVNDIKINKGNRLEKILIIGETNYKGEIVSEIFPFSESEYLDMLCMALSMSGKYEQPFIPIISDNNIGCKVGNRIKTSEIKR